MVKLKCPKCNKDSYTAAPEAVSRCGYCGELYSLMTSITEKDIYNYSIPKRGQKEASYQEPMGNVK